MSKMKLAIRELHRSEAALARSLRNAADRHKVDHEIHHVGHDIAGWSETHVRELAAIAPSYGLTLSEHPKERLRKLGVGALYERTSVAIGRFPQPGLLLLADLRRLHRIAAGVSLDWELLAQAAQATKDRELLALAKRCHPQSLRQMRWANAHLKVVSAQVLAS